MHEANKELQLEQYTNSRKQVEKFVKLFYTSLRTHRRENRRNRI